MLLIPTLQRQRLSELCEFQGIQDYIARLCFQKRKDLEVCHGTSLTPVIAIKRLTQKDCCEFQARLTYVSGLQRKVKLAGAVDLV